METKSTTRVYKISYTELKNKLGMKGNIEDIDYHNEFVLIKATEENK